MADPPPVQETAGRRFLILHGWQNHRPVGHWQWWLAERLRARGHEVSYPQLPDPERPALKEWLTVIEAELDRGPDVDQVVVAHSLACAAWIHLAGLGSVHLPVTRVLFVAPPSPAVLAGSAELREFQFAHGAETAVAKSSLLRARLAYSQDDPYCRPPAAVVYDKSSFDLDFLPGAGHLDMIAGYGRWQSVLRWCENPEERLTTD